MYRQRNREPQSSEDVRIANASVGKRTLTMSLPNADRDARGGANGQYSDVNDRPDAALTNGTDDDAAAEAAEQYDADEMSAEAAAEAELDEPSAHAQTTQLKQSEPGDAAHTIGAELPASFGGMPLTLDVRTQMQRAFQADFSGVSVHSDSPRASALGALAYAEGESIHMAPGQYDPVSQAGRELIGHELAHVVQQRAGRVTATRQAKGVAINDDPALEHEADDLGRRAAAGEIVAADPAPSPSSAGTAQMARPLQMVKTRSGHDTSLYAHYAIGKARSLRPWKPERRRRRGGGRRPLVRRAPIVLPPPIPTPVAVRNGPVHAPINGGGAAGMSIAIAVTSSSGVDADMVRIQDSESVGPSFNHTGSALAMPAGPSNTSGFMNGYPIPNDQHTSSIANILALADNHGGNGTWDYDQLDIYTDAAAGVNNAIAIPNSGYRVRRTITAGPGTLVRFRVDKWANAVAVNGFASAAGPSPAYHDVVTVRP